LRGTAAIGCERSSTRSCEMLPMQSPIDSGTEQKAAKRQKNTAHGVSGGIADKRCASPEGAKEAKHVRVEQ